MKTRIVDYKQTYHNQNYDNNSWKRDHYQKLQLIVLETFSPERLKISSESGECNVACFSDTCNIVGQSSQWVGEAHTEFFNNLLIFALTEYF